MSDMSWGLFLYLCSSKDRRFHSLSIDAGKECQADVLSNNDVIPIKYFTHGFVRSRRELTWRSKENVFMPHLLFHHSLAFIHI